MYRLFAFFILLVTTISCQSNMTQSVLICDFGRITRVDGSELEFCGSATDFPAQKRLSVIIHREGELPGNPGIASKHVKVGTALVQADPSGRMRKATLTSGYARVGAHVRAE
jgi:hypothetical protein